MQLERIVFNQLQQLGIESLTVVIKPPLALFHVKIERAIGNPVKFLQALLHKVPKVLDALRALGRPSVIHYKRPRIFRIYERVVTMPTVDRHTMGINAAANDCSQDWLSTVRHSGGKDLAAIADEPKHRRPI